MPEAPADRYAVSAIAAASLFPDGLADWDGATFRMPATPDSRLAIRDDDRALSGDADDDGSADDPTLQLGMVDTTGGTTGAARFHIADILVARDRDGNVFTLVVIEATARDDGTKAAFVTFFGDVPAAGDRLTVVARGDVGAAGLRYDDLAADPPPTELTDGDEAATVREESGPVALVNALANAYDPGPGGPAIVAVAGVGGNVGTPVAGSDGGLFTIGAGGVVLFEDAGDFAALAAGERATTTIAYTVGGSDGDAVTSTYSVTVRGVNSAPTPVDDVATTDAGMPATIDVLRNDRDPDTARHALFVLSVDDPAHGVATLGPGGTITYLADDGFAGVDSFDYVVSDGARTAVATVAVTTLPSGFGPLDGRSDLSSAIAAPATPALRQASIDFGAEAPGPADQILPSVAAVLVDAGLYEAVAFDVLARGSDAELVALGSELVYADPHGKRTDLAVSIDDTLLGVSITRASTFPFGTPLTPAGAGVILEKELKDIQLSTANLEPIDGHGTITRQVLVVLTPTNADARTLKAAYAEFDPSLRGDTILLCVRTDGADASIYGSAQTGFGDAMRERALSEAVKGPDDAWPAVLDETFAAADPGSLVIVDLFGP